MNLIYNYHFRTTSNLCKSSNEDEEDHCSEKENIEEAIIPEERIENTSSELQAPKRHKSEEVDELLKTCKSIIHGQKDDDCSYFAH